jgi:hypothetical protein
MGLTVKRNTALGVMIETTEGTYAAPSSASKFVQTLADGLEIKPSKEVIDRNIFTASVGKTAPRTGKFQASGTVPVEARANSSQGTAPEYDALLQSALGTKRTIATTTTTKSAGNTGSVLQIQDADISKFAVNDIILVKESGAYHVSPISAVDSTGGAANITLKIAKPTGSFSNSVVIAKATIYSVADSGHPSLSLSKYIENAVLEQAVGCKATSIALENFATGQLPAFKFGFEGLNFGRSVTPIPYTPSYDTSLPPIVLDGRAYMDTSAIEINELSFALNNVLGFETSIAAQNGRIASRVTERTITGTMDPYKLDNSTANFDKYTANTSFSLFAYAKVPTGVTGEFGQIVAVFMPNCLITDLGEADQDGLLKDSITFSANRGSAGTSPEIYVAFI